MCRLPQFPPIRLVLNPPNQIDPESGVRNRTRLEKDRPMSGLSCKLNLRHSFPPRRDG